jgi:hypothetical protein
MAPVNHPSPERIKPQARFGFAPGRLPRPGARVVADRHLQCRERGLEHFQNGRSPLSALKVALCSKSHPVRTWQLYVNSENALLTG